MRSIQTTEIKCTGHLNINLHHFPFSEDAQRLEALGFTLETQNQVEVRTARVPQSYLHQYKECRKEEESHPFYSVHNDLKVMSVS